MPFDSYYVGSGVEVLRPNDIMNSHFSEPGWSNAPNPVRSVKSLGLPVCPSSMLRHTH